MSYVGLDKLVKVIFGITRSHFVLNHQNCLDFVYRNLVHKKGLGTK